MTRTTTSTATFTQEFRLPNMDEAYPAGTYDIETDDEPLDTMAGIGYRRAATRIWLKKLGTTQLLQVNQKDLDAALSRDAAPAA